MRKLLDGIRNFWNSVEAVDVVAAQTELQVVLTSEACVEVQLSVVAKGEGVLVSNLVLVGGISSQATHEQLNSLLDVLGVADSFNSDISNFRLQYVRPRRL